MKNNSIMVISPYLENGVWVFDDPATGLVREPFVAGMPEIFREMVGDAQRFTACFSALPFPGHTYVLQWVKEESGGNWYALQGAGRDGWLCPALLKYFEKAPTKIYIRIEEASCK